MSKDYTAFIFSLKQSEERNQLLEHLKRLQMLT
jgi:hypothetical protein